MSIPIKPIRERVAIGEAKFHANKIVNRVLQNRGVSTIEDITYSLKNLLDPFLLKNMKEATVLLEKHLRKGSRVLVIGDYDCDGATSTSIAVEGLKLLGFKDVDFLIPDRVIHGYGLTPSIVQLAAESEPDLIVTVDNGIASLDGAKAVKNMYMNKDGVRERARCELLITDHHLPLDSLELPDSDCLVNPSQPGCQFPSKALAGCGVMFYTIMALRAHLRDCGYFAEIGIEQPNISQLLDLVALGTVADVVPLDKNNRNLVDAGLRRIRAGHGRPGIKAILEIAGKDPKTIVSSDFGFAIGPRINAAGRLEDMSQGIRCLLSSDYKEALEMAERLDELNKQRRDIEADHVFDASQIIEKFKLYNRKGVVIHDPTWHVGVVGIVASRIKEKINRPIICMTDTDVAEEARLELLKLKSSGASEEQIQKATEKLGLCDVKGSARSIDGVHLKHVLDKISKAHPEILTKFGGHAMAAGLSLKYKHLDNFIKIFDDEISKIVTEDQLIGSIDVDVKDAPASEINLELATTFRAMGPWGQHFPEPVLHGRLKMVGKPKIRKEKHLSMTVSFEGSPEFKFEAIAFNCVENGEMPVGEVFDGAFTLDINEFRGKSTLQFIMRFLQDPQLIAQRNRDAIENERTKEARVKAQKELEEQVDKVLAENRKEKQSPVESQIKGLPKQELDAPVARLREEMHSVLEHLKKSAIPRTKSTDEPMPF